MRGRRRKEMIAAAAAVDVGGRWKKKVVARFIFFNFF